MNITKEQLLLYAVTDRHWVGNQSFLEQIESALKGGITMLQLREKNLQEDDFLREALTVKEICNAYHVPLIINDNVSVALKSGADGVHLGQKDCSLLEARTLLGTDKIIGATVKTMEQALKAQDEGADYLGSGAVFSTSTKTDTWPINHRVFAEICKFMQIPVCAIGGITLENLPKLKGLGASGFALVSGIFAAEDIEQQCCELKKIALELTSER